MRLKVFAVDRDVPAGLCGYAGSTVWWALHRLGRYVRRVTVRLRPGEVTFTCRVDVWLGRIGSVIVEHSNRDPREAVRLAAMAARGAVRRRVREHVRGVAATEPGAGAARPPRDVGATRLRPWGWFGARFFRSGY